MLAGEVYAAERAVWVWNMANDIVLDDPPGSRATFFGFCDAPHGDPEKAVTIVYLSDTARGRDLVSSFAEELRGFLAAAHARGLTVECLTGDKYWTTPEHREDGEARCDAILAFNAAGSSDAERFDGIHYDVEPQGLRFDRGDDYDWDAHNATLWSQYLTLLDYCQTQVNAYNTTHTDIQFGADIAWWFDTDSHPGTPADVQTRIDYVTIMDYRQTGPLLVDGATTEIGTADSLGKEAYVGVETAPAVFPDPDTITFYEEGNDFMEDQLTYTESAFSVNPGFGGFAIHYYEDTSRGERAYRSLTNGTFPGYSPEVELTFPNGDEGIELVPGTPYEIRWTATDQDTADGDLVIDIDYSSDSGQTWLPLTITPEANDGTYTWNTTGLSDGSTYRIKVTATDLTPLSGYDTSDYDFGFSSTPTPVPDWADGQNTGVNGIRPIVIPDGNVLHMVWYWPGWGGLPKGVYYKKSLDKGNIWGPTITLAENDTTEPRKSALAVRGSTVAAVWVEGTGALGAQVVKVRISSDGGDNWNSAEEIQGDYSEYKWAEFPDIAVDTSNAVHAVWGARKTTGDQQWEIHYNSKPAGGNWAGRATVSEITPGHIRGGPAIISDPNGIHVVWGEFTWIDFSQYKIQYRKNSGAWGTIAQIGQRAIPDIEWGKKYFPDIYSDTSNKLHVVWQYTESDPSTTSATSDVYYTSMPSGGSWVSPAIVATGYVPQVSADGGELRLIYYRPNATTANKGDIRYKTSTNGGTNWSTEDTLTTDARVPYDNSDVPFMVGFPSIASGTMVASWRGFSNDRIMFSYKGVLSAPNNLVADLVYNTSDSIKLTWEKPSDYTPNHYAVYRSVNSGAYSSVNSAIYDVEYTDTGLSGANYYKYRVNAVEGAMASLTSNTSNALYPGPDNFLIDYFEGFEGISYSTAGESDLNWSYETTEVHEGSQSLRLDYAYTDPAPDGWGAALAGTFPAHLDLLNYASVKFWAKGGTVGGAAIKFQLIEANRPEGNETWESEAVTISSTNWTEYEFKFSDFKKVDSVGGTGNARMDMRSMGAYGLGFSGRLFNPVTPDGTYYVDHIRLIRQAAEISVPQASYAFTPDPLIGTVDNHRFVLGPIPVSYGGFRPPWTVRIWTDNGTGADKAGLVGVTDPSQVIPLKAWCLNYGPALTVPDEENDYFYSGFDFGDGVNIGREYRDGDKADLYTSGTFDENYWGFDINGNGTATDIITASLGNRIGEEPVWLRVPEDDEMNPLDERTWRRLVWSPGKELTSPFDLYLAIDVEATGPQVYETTTLTLEFINE